MPDLRDLSSAQRYQLLADAADAHAIIFLDVAGNIVEWSAGAQKLFGWSAEEVMDKSAALIFTAEDHAANELGAELKEALEHGQALDIRWHVRKDGSSFYADGIMYAIFDDTGEHVGFSKILRPAQSAFGRRINGRRQEFAAEREFLAAVLDNIEDGVVACSPEGNLTVFNRATRDFHGLSEVALGPESWVGHYDLYRQDGVTPLPKEEVPLFRALQGERVRDARVVIAPEGEKARIVSINGQPLISEDGEKLGAVVSLHEITDQHEAQVAREQAVQEQVRREHAEKVANFMRLSEERFRSLVMATAQIVWTCDAQGKLEEESPTWCAFTGQSHESAKGEGWLNAVHPDDRASSARAWSKSNADETLYQTEYRLRRWDGEYRWTTARGVPIRAADGSVREWVGINVDVTDVRKAEAALRESEREAVEAARQAEAERSRLNAVLEAVPIGILVADADGTILEVNAENARLFDSNQTGSKDEGVYGGWTGRWADESERHGQPIAPEDWPLARSLRGELVPHTIIELESPTASPLRRTCFSSAAPIRDGNSRISGAVVAVMDITDRVKVEASLRETAERLRFTLDSTQIGDWDLDLITGKSYRSMRHDECFGFQEPVEEWGFESFIERVYPDDREHTARAYATATQNLEDLHIECRVIWPDESLHWIAIHGSFYSTGGRPARLVGIIYDITDRKAAEDVIRHASLHDPLTGLPNRAMLFEYASRLLSHNKRINQRAAVLFIDLDRFKPINDTHGHQTGDAVLKEVADRLKLTLRAEDLVVRLGGDEFLVLLQDVKRSTYAGEVARHLMARLNEPYGIGELTLTVSASIGISTFPGDGEDIDALISHADMAMYRAKQAGRNNFQFYSLEFEAETRQQLLIEQQLKSALRNDYFHLYYQPVLDVQSGEIVSVEALLRWQNGDIGPDQFVPVAEATGIINPIGRWLLKEASRQYKTWLEHGLPAVPIAVNMSVVEFRDRDFVSRFKQTIQDQGIDMNALQLEVTETAVMDDFDHAVSVLSQLRALGVTILLDDFGIGHSSLAYLARLPLDKVKIDKSFVSALESDLASRAVAEAMIALGRTLSLVVVAEGIESAGVLEYVRGHGCSQGQGFYLASPMPASAFESWYWEHRRGLGKTAG